VTAMAADRLTPTELAAWRGLLEAHARVTHALDAQMRSEHGLPVSSYEVLMFLAEAPGKRMRMSDIADRVLLSRSGLTRLVDRLEQLGLVSRCAAEDDGRGAYAKLTDAGLEQARHAGRTHLEGVRRYFLDHLTEDDHAALAAVWDRLERSTP
jgi:DNA-binding MarR family transcriptional regulator